MKPELDKNRLITKKEAAQILGVSTKTIERLTAREILNPVRILGAIRFKLQEILEIYEKGIS